MLKHNLKYGWFVAGLLLLLAHLYLSARLGLSVDEAHYALYALYPALSYFDHPPLVGWLQIPFIWLGGTEWLLRIAPLVLWGITAWWLAVQYTRWSLLLFVLAAMHQILGLALLPDSLLLPLTLWTMHLSQRLADNPKRLSDWCWLGCALGLAGLAKYSAVFLFLGALLVLLPRHGFSLLRLRGPWLGAALTLAMMTPIVLWNAQNDWASFTYQFTHVKGDANTWQAKPVVAFALIQILAYGTLPLFGLVIFYLKLGKVQRRLALLCSAFGLPLLLSALWLSGHNATLPHWTASAWLALLPIAALGLQHAWQLGAGQLLRPLRMVILGLGSLQLILLSVLGLALAMGGQMPQASTKHSGITNTTSNWERGNPFADLHDWREAGKMAQGLAAKYSTDALVVSNWTLASRLAWYSRRIDSATLVMNKQDSTQAAWPRKNSTAAEWPRVFALDRKNKQFELWFGQLAPDDLFIWLDWSQMPQPLPRSCWSQGQSSQPHQPIDVHQGLHSRFSFYLCKPSSDLN